MKHLLLCTLIALTACAHTPLAFDAGASDGPGANAQGELFLPDGVGPFPAVVLLHGCDGVGPHYRAWARRLSSWGYAALLVDSFGPRHVTTVCNHGMTIPPELQAQDGFSAAEYLRSRPDIQPDRIGVIGFSHGGWAVLKAVLAGAAARAHARPFAAAIAFYPGCDAVHATLATDTLILIGDADDWTPAQRCIRWRDAIDKDDHTVDLKIYPGAFHGFDAALAPHQFAGHTVGRNPAAAEDAITETRAFLQRRLTTKQSSAPQ
jgi:dienelactone hydrolase